ncbi:MAG: hypothetical protein ABUT39_02945 [Acidobacteriota bacterium]
MTGETQAELQAYLANPFDLGSLGPETVFPLPDEPFVEVWERWAAEARERGAFAVLSDHLPQLRFPVREGIGATEGYRAAVRRGVPPSEIPSATGLEIGRPDLVGLEIHESPAGRIPVILARGRDEFAALLRALSRKNEPVPVPDSQGALMVSGYNNWERIRERLRRGEDMQDILPRKELYQDRFILLSDGPYSAVPAADLGLDDAEWRRISLEIRRDHECAHYFTRRLFGSMRNNVLDELIADYAGMVAATGTFRGDWFLRFLGLEDYPRYRPGGRLDLYRGDPPLSDAAFHSLHELIRSAAETLERFDGRASTLSERALVLSALASLRLDDLAAPDGIERLERALSEVRGRLGWRAVG